MSEEYVAIHVNTLRGDIKIPFDVYVKVGSKYILYVRQGSSFEGERLDRLKAKKLRKMYVRPDDDIPYRQYLEESIDSAYDLKSDKDIAVRAEVIQGFQQAASEQYMEDPQYEFSYNHMKSSVQRFAEFLTKSPATAYTMVRLKNTDQSISQHSVNVAALSTLVALNSKYKDSAKIPLLATGCMIHDLEHFATGFNVGRPLKDMPKNELTLYKEHPLKGATRIQTAGFMDQLVINVVLQHEEDCIGSGFPKGLFEKDMDPLVLVAASVNAFDRLVSFEGLKIRDAMKHMFLDKLGSYPLDLIQVLQRLVKDNLNE